MSQSGITPAAAVLVTTVRSIRNQGEGADFERGLPNLGKHIEILQKFGVPTIAAINRFPTDTDDELNRDRKSTRLNSSHLVISYAVFCLKKKKYITSDL